MADAAPAFAVPTAICLGCGRGHALNAHSGRCDCPRGENLVIRHRLDGITAEAVRDAVAYDDPTLWRYAPLLPVARPRNSRLPVGWTPLLDVGRVGAARLFLKDETRLPSGSIKDRASEIVVAVSLAHGIGRVVVASTGNAAASLACIGAAAGIEVTVLVPETVPPAKLAQALAYGARVHRVAGRYDEAFIVAERFAGATGAINRSTGLNPYTREGKKTCAFEIAEQLGWESPDWVIVPTGDGNIISAIGQGFAELAALRLISHVPRLVAAQSVASCAISRRFRHDIGDDAPDGVTIADSITVGVARDGTAALAALTASDGVAVTVDDEDIVAAVRTMGSRFGVFAEPSSAAAFAAFEKLSAAGTFAPDERVACLVTGNGLKDLRPILDGRMDEDAAIDPADWRSLLPSGSASR